MIKEFDIDLINKIVEPFNIEPTQGKENDSGKIWGYKFGKNLYYSFFFTLHKKEVLLFTFRFDPTNLSNIRIYVTYDNIDVIQTIIKAILNKQIVSNSVFKDYIYEINDKDKKVVDIKEEGVDNFEPIRLDERFFEITETDFINSCSLLKLYDYKQKGLEIINTAIDIVTSSSLSDRNKDIYLKYNNYISGSKYYTLQNLADKYNLSRERVRQLLKKTQVQLKSMNRRLIALFNEITGEEQYAYLIYGIMQQRNFRNLKAILLFVLNEKDYERIKKILYNCIFIVEGNDINDLSLSKDAVRTEDSKDYLNAPGSFWDLNEDQQLIEEVIMGKTINEIAAIHSRTASAIKGRISKLKQEINIEYE